MLPLTSLAAECLYGSHGVAYRAGVTSASFGTLSNLAISGASITDDATSQTRRSGTVYLADVTLWPANPTDVLSPLDAEMTVEQGIIRPDGVTEWISLGIFTVGEVDDTVPVASNGLTVQLQDRSQKIHDDQYGVATTLGGAGTTFVNVIKQIITRTYPSAQFSDQTGGDATACPAFQVQQDPWSEGVEVCATTMGWEVFCDQLGNWVIRPIPTLASPPVWVAQTGPHGNLVTNARTQSRSSVYNIIIVTAAASNSAAPITVTVQDTNPNSPTNVNGPFGRKPFPYQAPLATSSAQCLVIGQTLLAMSEGASYTASIGIIANPALCSGDVMRLIGDTGNKILIIDSVEHNADAGSPQTIVGRTTEVGDISQTGV